MYNNELVALSQYFDACFFKELGFQKDQIEKDIREFYDNKLKDLVPLDEYIIDFGITDEEGVKVIELNPYNPNTDSCLFSWSRDAEILKSGPFEFRIVPKPIPNLSSQVLSCWKPYLSSE